MTELVDEIKELFALYPPWLVYACLVVVAIGLGYVIWKIMRFGMVIVVTVLLAAIVGFAGWMILSP